MDNCFILTNMDFSKGFTLKHILNFINASGEFSWNSTNIYVVNCESFTVKPRPYSEPPSPPMDTGQRLNPKFNYLETEIIYAGELFSFLFYDLYIMLHYHFIRFIIQETPCFPKMNSVLLWKLLRFIWNQFLCTRRYFVIQVRISSRKLNLMDMPKRPDRNMNHVTVT